MGHMSAQSREDFIPRHGGYAGFVAYQKALIHQPNYLLDQLIRKLEKHFLAERGLRERMTRGRLAQGAKQTERRPTTP
jgi:four helix bundle suffix protein